MAELTEAERAKIQNYVTTIMEGADDSWEELQCATTEATTGKSVSQLKDMLVRRGLKTTGNKAELIRRVTQDKPVWRGVWLRCVRNATLFVARHIDRFGDDGMGEKSEEMCRVEYWLAHLNPDQIRE